mmetsp:Transcript_57546/g.140549  ORF Transcript_57546/g.140549 Transcript_57546/m.140549 type:complete len:211 (+) Transcript_57546:45-677(+)
MLACILLIVARRNHPSFCVLPFRFVSLFGSPHVSKVVSYLVLNFVIRCYDPSICFVNILTVEVIVTIVRFCDKTCPRSLQLLNDRSDNIRFLRPVGLVVFTLPLIQQLFQTEISRVGLVMAPPAKNDIHWKSRRKPVAAITTIVTTGVTVFRRVLRDRVVGNNLRWMYMYAWHEVGDTLILQESTDKSHGKVLSLIAKWSRFDSLELLFP